MIYCGYQGCGKSTYCRNHPDTAYDLDSSTFFKGLGWERIYVDMAVDYSNKGYDVFISAHKEVIKYLMEQEIPFELFYPNQDYNAWNARLQFRYYIKPTQANANAVIDFQKNFHEDMEFYKSLDCVKHEIAAHIVTNIGDFI